MNQAPQAGDAAPDISLPATDGEVVTLERLRGAPVVLFFYPKDDTSGCTREALSFTEAADQFEALGVRVIGVSRDSLASHERFRTKHGLKVALASDETGAACEAYGVWVEKSMYGRQYMGIERSTFLIDADGVVREVWRKVKVPGHAEAVLQAARALRGGKRD